MSASLLGSVGVCNKRVKANKGQKSQATIYLTKEYQVANTKTDFETLCQKKRKSLLSLKVEILTNFCPLLKVNFDIFMHL